MFRIYQIKYKCHEEEPEETQGAWHFFSAMLLTSTTSKLAKNHTPHKVQPETT
jgi:hypothetical protein